MNIIQTAVTEQTIAALEAGRHFREVLDRVKDGENFVVEGEGKPVAAVIPFNMYKQLKKIRESFFHTIETMQTNSYLDEEEAMELANQAVKAIRKEAKANKH